MFAGPKHKFIIQGVIFLSIFVGALSNVSLASDDLNLNEKEAKWLKKNSSVSFTGDPNWLPYEAFDKDDNYVGIVSEHLKLINSMTGINFVMSPSKTWTESTEKAKQGTVDILSETDDSDLKSHLNFTKPYITNPIVIAMKHTENYVERIDDIKNKKIALIKDYGYASKIRRKYSNIKFITVEDIHDGLVSVSTGEIDALLCTLALCSYTISELGLNNVKITGKTEFDTKLALGVQKNLPELLSILNKAIANISHEQQQLILDQWIKNKFLARVDYTLVYQIVAAAFVLLSLFAFWVFRLSQEIKLRIETEDKLDESTQRYQILFDKTADAILILENGHVADCNQATLDMFDYRSKQEMFNAHPSNFSPEYQDDGQSSEIKANSMIQTALVKGSNRFEWNHQRTNGDIFPVEVSLTVIPFAGRQLIHAVMRDITQRKTDAAEIEHYAYYDSLTGLPNRKLLLDRLKQALITSHRHEYFGALLFIDLDRFKTINDSLGHSIGDKLLIEVASRIKSCLWDEDTVCRFGGDEFIVLLRHLGLDKSKASLTGEKVASRILNEFKAPFLIGEHELHISSSIGIALYPFKGQGVDDIIKHADTAMYSAKQNGRNQIAFYLSELHEKVGKRLELEKDLRKAIKNNQLDVYYQPLINSEAEIIAVEALARWEHQEYGFIQPEKFIAIAEDTGLIYSIGDFVLNKAVTDVLEINNEHTKSLKLSVNISPYQFRKSDFVERIKKVIDDKRISMSFLTLEVTERITIENIVETIDKFKKLRVLGVRLSLDDFGTGYSSLTHLKKLPIDELKIDKSFVFDINDDHQDALLVKSIINIAHQFDLDVVAEGVETKEQLAFLKKENCNIYQGFYFSKPLPIRELKNYLLKEKDIS